MKRIEDRGVLVAALCFGARYPCVAGRLPSKVKTPQVLPEMTQTRIPPKQTWFEVWRFSGVSQRHGVTEAGISLVVNSRRQPTQDRTFIGITGTARPNLVVTTSIEGRIGVKDEISQGKKVCRSRLTRIAQRPPKALRQTTSRSER